MAAVSIRGLDESVRTRLRQRAAVHGRSMEAEMRAILTEAVEEPTSPTLFSALAERFGGIDLDLPRRETPPRSFELSG